jgi:O-antigen/teichoic acid export membrane protein
MDEEIRSDVVLEIGRLDRHLRSSAGVVLIGEAAYRLGTFVILLILARSMSPTDYGSAAIFFAVLTLGGAIAQFGLPQAAVRLIASRLTNGRPEAVRSAWSTWWTAALVAVVLYPLSAYVVLPATFHDFVHDAQLADVAPLVAIGIVFEGFQITVAEIFRGFHRVGAAVALGFAGRAAVVVSATAALALDDAVTVHRIVAVYAVAVTALWLVGSLAMVRLLRGSSVSGQGQCNLPWTARWRAVCALALPIVVITVANRVLVQGDTLVVGHLASRVDTATYNLASRVCNLLFVPYVAGTLTLAPVVAGLWTRNERDRIERVVRSAATLASLVAVVAAVIAAAAGGPAIRVVFGGAYSGAGVLLTLLAIGPVAAAVTTGAGVVLTSSGHQRAAMLGSVVVTIATVGVEFAFGEVSDARGVAVGSAVGSVAQAVVMAVLAWRLVEVRSWPTPHIGSIRAALGRSG